LRVALQGLAAEGIGPQPDPEHPEWLRLGPTTIRPWEASDGGYAGIDDAGYQYLLDFSATGFPRLTVGDLLRGEFEPAALRDKMVLIGVNARSLPDFHRVPVETESGIPGIQTHAYMVRQLIRAGLGEASPIRVLANWQESVLIALLALAGCAVALGLRRGSAVQGVSAEVLAILLGLGALWLGGGLAYRAGWWVPMAAPAAAWLASAGVLTAWSSSRERAERAQVMMIFSRHVSKRLAEELWRRRDEFFDGGRLRPGRVTATLLFLDMKGYTSRAEKMDPQSLMEWINDFMGAMAERVDEFDGYVDDYFGDGIKAAFGVPIPRTTEAEIRRDASNAVDCALAMASSLELLNAKYREHDMPTVAMRIGIHTGPVVVGNLGSAERLKYTSVGDVVITAQRLEGIDRVEHDFERHPCRILISDATRARLGDRHECESLGSFALKGMEEEVAIHRVLAVKP
jgi:adenylate cyclase